MLIEKTILGCAGLLLAANMTKGVAGSLGDRAARRYRPKLALRWRRLAYRMELYAQIAFVLLLLDAAAWLWLRI